MSSLEATLRLGSGDGDAPDGPAPEGDFLDRRLCQVVGLNENYTSSVGTPYHIQIEDRGPVNDRVTEAAVRRVNVVVYANYGEANARITYSRDYDFEDLRTREHNAFVKARIAALAAEARRVIEEKEARVIARVKDALREYYLTKSDGAKQEFEEANAAYPFLFSRAWSELKQERAGLVRPVPPRPAPPAEEPEVAAPEEVLYPLDADLREKVIEIERLIIEVGQDLSRLKAAGKADDILIQTCRKLVMRAKESLSGRDPTEFSSRRLDMTRNSLMTTWRQIKSRLR